jgi:glycosyltransferase involved in cell wall biosynthesis
MSAMAKSRLRLSIIIANHNTGDYVGAAIQSALAVAWPDKEVIVVDDASTDHSRQVIDRFGAAVQAHFRPKSHQLGAQKFGFERSDGDVVILLDADDLLETQVMREVARVWRLGISKVQFRMALIGPDGVQLGTAIPQFPANGDHLRLRRGFLRTMAYTTPPGSGNAYAREFMAEAYAMAPPTMRWSDDVLLTLAPILGDVLTIRKPLARYRIHAANDGALGVLDAAKFRHRLRQDVEKAELFSNACRQLSLQGTSDPLGRSPHHLQYRLASYLIEPVSHPFPEDRFLRLFCRLIYALTQSTLMPLRDKAFLIGWTIACALMPTHHRRNLVQWRFAPSSRPAVIGRVLAVLSSLRVAQLPDGP